MNIAFQNLELIPKLIDKIDTLQYQLSQLSNQKNKINLTKLSNVANYLGVSKTTVLNYIKDGRFKENVHYKKHIVNSMVKYIYVENAIIKFKESI